MDSHMHEPVILSSARTAIAKFQGGLASFSAPQSRHRCGRTRSVGVGGLIAGPASVGVSVLAVMVSSQYLGAV